MTKIGSKRANQQENVLSTFIWSKMLKPLLNYVSALIKGIQLCHPHGITWQIEP